MTAEVLVVAGYGLKIRVENTYLKINHGVGDNQRLEVFARSSCKLERIVVLGYTGYVSLEAVRWLSDMEIQCTVLDSDSNVIATWGPERRATTQLRVMQCLASQSPAGIEFTRWLLSRKFVGHLNVLESLGADRAVSIIKNHLTSLQSLDGDIPAFRLVEAAAANTYWEALQNTPTKWARGQEVPEHWQTLQPRGHGLSSNRHATDPINALLNYGYALAAFEAKIAITAAGFDAGFGILHSNLEYRDNFVWDVVEGLRSVVDVATLEYVTKTTTFVKDCAVGKNHHVVYECRDGEVRLDDVVRKEITGKLLSQLRIAAQSFTREAREVLTDVSASIIAKVG